MMALANKSQAGIVYRLVMMEIPTIETARLRLRGHRPQDLDDCAAMWGDPEVTKYIGGRPFTREEVWARLLRYAGHWTWLGYGFWVIEERESNRFLGEVGLADFKRDIQPPLISGPEAGWVLKTDSHGQGFATEALSTVTRWHQSAKEPETISCVIHPENLASIKVALKCGFQLGPRAAYKGQATTVYRLHYPTTTGPLSQIPAQHSVGRPPR